MGPNKHIVLILLLSAGSVYLEQCPRERYIPIYLLVVGVLGVVKYFSINVQIMKGNLDKNGLTKKCSFFNMVDLFILASFVPGWFVCFILSSQTL